MIGSGGHVGHCVVAAWKDNELYILEAQDALYWPRRGIQKNKWEDWVKWANTAEFNVVHLPLRDEYRNKLNADKAWAWFENEMEGLPYGYHNFVFSWIDTEKDSFPFITTNEFEELFFSLLSKFYPAGFDLLAREGLNFRLNTTNLNFQQIITEAARKGLKHRRRQHRIQIGRRQRVDQPCHYFTQHKGLQLHRIVAVGHQARLLTSLD